MQAQGQLRNTPWVKQLGVFSLESTSFFPIFNLMSDAKDPKVNLKAKQYPPICLALAAVAETEIEEAGPGEACTEKR